MISLVLTIPPSLNQAYRNVPKVGRVKTRAHIDWKKAAGWEVKAQTRERIEGPYRLKIGLPISMRGDVSNRMKLPEDLLVELGITPDDKHCVSATAERRGSVLPGTCIVTVEAA